ncbi:MAG TPA: hypothetical protein VMG10_25915 [Gemmataceae bacterium]|nr:hypothetical protein [Gemmataceae bacterium]
MRFRDVIRASVVAASILFVCLLSVATATADPPLSAAPALCLEQLAAMSWCDLEQIYRQAPPGTIPAGYARGRAIYCPCAPLTPARSKMTQAMWHGKHFCPADGTLINQWCFGRTVRARVCYGDSWLDGKPSIVMDYRGMAHVWKDVRDEIREVAPGLYLGLMYRCKSGQPRMKMFFALEMTPCGP